MNFSISLSILYSELGLQMRQMTTPPGGPAPSLSDDFQVISENKLLASINMRRTQASQHTITSSEVRDV